MSEILEAAGHWVPETSSYYKRAIALARSLGLHEMPVVLEGAGTSHEDASGSGSEAEGEAAVKGEKSTAEEEGEEGEEGEDAEGDAEMGDRAEEGGAVAGGAGNNSEGASEVGETEQAAGERG